MRSCEEEDPKADPAYPDFGTHFLPMLGDGVDETLDGEMQPCCCWDCPWAFVGVMGRRHEYTTARRPGNSQGCDFA